MGRHHRFPAANRRRRFLPHVLALTFLLVAGWFGNAGIDYSKSVALGLPTSATRSAEPTDPPCPPQFRACVALGARQAWLRDDDGRVVLGPVTITPGSPDLPTPTGEFSVKYKDIDHVSSIYDTPMPFSVFFDDERGYAFHEGDTSQQSAGCIRLTRDDAQRFYDELEVDDQVQIVP